MEKRKHQRRQITVDITSDNLDKLSVLADIGAI